MIARPSHPPPASPPRAREKQAARNAGSPSHGGILRPLGFYGLDGIEVSIVAGLVTGDPVLLVGGHGSAKTALVRRIATELGLAFWAYDASKALFEDVIGFPNPWSLAEGEVSYVPTPLSIWNKQFVLVDEISRASPAMQNKWFEVVRSRRIMGREIAGLRYVFAAMNPPGYLGAIPLDEALAGRFALVVPMPAAREMDERDVAAIVGTVTADDAPLCQALRENGNGAARDGGAAPPRSLARIVEAAREAMPRTIEANDEVARAYVQALATHLAGKRVSLDGRRLGMIRRNLLSALAVEGVLSPGRFDPGRRERIFFTTLTHSLPHRALGEDLPTEALYPCHALAYGSASQDSGSRRGRLAFATILGRRDLTTLLESYEARIATLTEEDHHQALNTILEELEGAKGRAKAAPFAALLAFTRIACLSSRHVPSDVVGRAMETVERLCAYGVVLPTSYQEVLLESKGPAPDPGSLIESLVLRFATESEREDRHDPSARCDIKGARSLYGEIEPALRTVLDRPRALPRRAGAGGDR